MSGQAFRLPSGGRIDRTRPVTIRFDGEAYRGFAGDSVASLLLANGVHLMGRSFKYHRPRGLLSHGSDEPNALLEVDRGSGRRDPNNRASLIAATDGLVVASQNRYPSLAFDIGAINDRLSAIFTAGFYYKTFMWPRAFWDRVYEPVIRAAAGLGRAPEGPDRDRYANRHATCEVLIVGAGPAGLAAALAAARSGKRVILADEQSEPGGTLLHERDATIDGRPAQDWLADTLATLDGHENVTILPRTTAFGYYNHNHVTLVERVSDHLGREAPAKDLPRERLWQVRAGEVVLATGAHERPLVFPDNDRPGIMLAETLRILVNRYAVAPGRRVAIATSSASAYSVAHDLRSAGLEVVVVDVRAEAACWRDAQDARAVGIEVVSGHTIVGTTGRHRVSGLVVAPLRADGSVGHRRRIPCDCVGMSGGWTPAVHLFSQSRGKLAYDAARDLFVPGTSAQAERSAGAARGDFDLESCLVGGFAAGLEAAGLAPEPRAFAASETRTGFAPVRDLPRDAEAQGKRAFVDFQNDVTQKDLALAVREGFTAIEHVKRYTTTGMATDQGKTSNMNALGLVAQMLDAPVPAIGTTTFRPPYTPVSFGALVGPNRGDLFDPVRRTPIHDWAETRGAVFEPVGLWRRALYYPKPGEDMEAAVARECRAVRRGVGLFDASTLGKIEVVGPDAAEFMNRIYVNAWSKLAPGKCRYGVMCKEDGFVMDDGVVARLAEDRFHVTTTTGGAARVLAHMEDYLQTEWPELRVFLTSVSEQWAVVALQGPKAREVLAPLLDDIDLSPDAFPHMSVREGHILGVRTRLFRVSFTGELGYEINVPADFARAIWEAVHEAGRPHGITPYGTQAMHVLRAEKGFVIVGQETDGTVTPDDVGLSGMIGKAKRDFVGKRSLARPDLVARGRKQLVGIFTEDPDIVLDEGAQIVVDPGAPVPVPMIGHVTSSYRSETCGRSIALALVAGGRERLGERVFVTLARGFASARIVEPVFYDRSGERVHA